MHPVSELPPCPRIGILGLFGENTVFREPLDGDTYPWMVLETGENLNAAIADPQRFIAPETRGFYEEMTRGGAWQPVPVFYALASSGPQLAEDHLQKIMAEIRTRLAAEAPFDGIYITGHGSFVAEQTRDVDGALLGIIREMAGDVPIVETLDLHGQITVAMMNSADLLIAYRTDPHVDGYERGVEAAQGMRRLLAGEVISMAYCRLPLMMPTAAIVAETSPFQDLVALGQRYCTPPIANVSILPGYPFTDSPDAGFHVLVSSWREIEPAERLARQIATEAWRRREGFAVKLASLAEMQHEVQALSADPSLSPACFADIADNPGGGGTGNTVDALEALMQCDAQGVALGPFWDPQAAALARQAGLGETIEVTLNEGFRDRFARPLAVKARVVALADGPFSARRGPANGMQLDQGSSASLQIGGIVLLVISKRLQAFAVEQFEMVGVDVARLRAIVVKSRGHYQSSFGEFFPRARMIEIDTLGWTSPKLELLEYRRVSRPILPLDRQTCWDERLFHRKPAAE